MENLTRRNIRYICFRLQTAEKGGVSPPLDIKEGIMRFAKEIQEHMQTQEGFGGWGKFAMTWDVDELSPWVVVRRKSSIYSEWNRTVEREARDLPKQIEDEPKKLENSIKKTKKPSKDLDKDQTKKKYIPKTNYKKRKYKG